MPNNYISLSSNGSGGDPLFASVKSLIHFEGPDGSSSITDIKGNTVTSNLVTLSTSQPLSGNSSAVLPGNVNQSIILDYRANIGAQDFCIEMLLQMSNINQDMLFIDTRPRVNGGCLTLPHCL